MISNDILWLSISLYYASQLNKFDDQCDHAQALIFTAPPVGQCWLQALLDLLEGAVERHYTFLGPQTLRTKTEKIYRDDNGSKADL